MYTIIKIGGKVNNPLHHEIIAHKRKDILDLPTSADKISTGSTCRVMYDKSLWMLDFDQIWKEIDLGASVQSGEGWSRYDEIDMGAVYKYCSWRGSLTAGENIIDKLLLQIYVKTGLSLSENEFELKSVQVWSESANEGFEINGVTYKTGTTETIKPSFYASIDSVTTFTSRNDVYNLIIDFMYVIKEVE